jgi:hypothetical protein
MLVAVERGHENVVKLLKPFVKEEKAVKEVSILESMVALHDTALRVSAYLSVHLYMKAASVRHTFII